ncbi:uncharacterized protein LOC106066832 isoform X1 [Biomphalaria glabrata]|uniref:Uncharacterized protein LOC106066832 isoform X1 n=1 Tax=Biomphalaria glabrata TaxID=6526 RepID=A0A9W2Z539_BIOGL|nr:uncharacterized protein LOC106066832 isoform X1 [Biomphalaria glabrata]
MSKVDKECLRRNYTFVTNEIDALELVDRLVESEAIGLSSSDRTRIVDINSNIVRNSVLVNIILNSSSEYVLNSFLKSLEPKYKHVLDKLKQQELRSIPSAKVVESLFQLGKTYLFQLGKSLMFQLTETQVNEQNVKKEKLRQENKELQETLGKLSILRTAEINSLTFEQEHPKSSRRDLPEPKDVSSINLNASSQQKLIPVKDFLLTHLPPCYQHVEMLSLIRSLVDITVKIEVNDVDQERKQFWDGVQTSVLTSKSLDTMDVPGSAEGNPKNASTRKTENTFHEFSILHSKGDVKDFTGTSDGIRLSDVVLGSGKVDDVFIRTG